MPVLMMGGAGSASSDDCTATAAKVLKGFTAITADSDDEIITGTLEFNATAGEVDVFPKKTFYNNNVTALRTGSLAPNSISGLTATNYSTGVCVLSWTKPKSLWSGIRVGYKTGSYPTSASDSSATWFETSDANRTINVSVGYTYKFRAWNYLETSAGRIYGSYSDVSFVAPNNEGSATYKASGTWTVPVGVRKIDIFGVGGGGGGASGGSWGGGGGGGYTKTTTGISVTPSAKLSITIGAGGSAGTSGGTGGNGGETKVVDANGNTIFSVGGGQGGKHVSGWRNGRGAWLTGGDGGSGGGARAVTTDGSSFQNGGGRGGTNGGDGQDMQYATTPSYYFGGLGQHTTTGEWGSSSNTKYGGGGGGGGSSGHGAGSGGDGGGGSGASSGNTGSNGTANTGGGGGAGFYGSTKTNGGSGGSGILKIRWS